MTTSDLLIPAQFRRTPGDRDGENRRRFSPEVEADRQAHQIAASCSKLNQKERRRRVKHSKRRIRLSDKTKRLGKA